MSTIGGTGDFLCRAARPARAVCWAAGVACALGLAVAGRAQDQRPTFRGTSDLISVPVWVEDGNVPVTDLEASDFEIVDNGAPQDVAFLADGSVPVDLTVTIDLAGWGFLPVERVEADLEALGSLLEPGDRVRVLTSSQPFLREVVPWTEAGQEPEAVQLLTGGGIGARLNDVIVAALVAPRISDRRHVVAALLAGPENRASVDSSRVRDLGGHAQVVLYTYLVDMTRPREPLSGARGFIRQQGIATASGRPIRLMPVYAGWPPWSFERIDAIEEAARRTGGQPRDFKASVLDSLRDLLEEFRRSYVLYFQPAGVAESGEHELSVRVRGRPDLTVRNRAGYSSGERTTAAAPAPAPTGSASHGRARAKAPVADWCASPAGAPLAAADFPALLDRYADGDHTAVVSRLRDAADLSATVRLYRNAASDWIDADDDAARRRIAAAALALELASPGSPQPCSTAVHWDQWLEHRRPLLYWAAGVIGRTLRVQPGEREWYLAAIAMLQAMIEFRGDRNAYWPDAERLLLTAMARVPDEPRYQLARAIGLEQRYEYGTRRMQRSEVLGAFEKALTLGDNDVAAEVQLRFIEQYLDANEETSEATGPITDPDRRAAAAEMLARARAAERAATDDFVVYMSRFFRARIHDRLDQRAAAEAGYRAAREVYPTAQSASLALATLLYMRGEKAEAQRLVDAVLASPGAEDPWRVYHLQDYRRLPLYIDQMRAALTTSR